jgi:hypothetical protein
MSPPERVPAFHSLIRAFAKSFSTNEAAKAKFFTQLCAAAPRNTVLPAFLIRESLIHRQYVGSLYEALTERATGLSNYDRDYSYTALRDTNFNDFDAETALDQETDYKRSEPESERTTWQKEYLDYLIEHGRNAEAHRLIASIEHDLQRRFARPVWLRLTSIRLDVRTGQTAHAVEQLQWLVGIKSRVDAEEPKPPSIERLNAAVALLVDEGREREAQHLLEAAYARGIALGQFESTYFAGLARIAFERGDAKAALTWLQTMVDLTAPDNKEQTVASLMMVQVIATQTDTVPQSEEVQFDRTTALRLAAETASEFRAYDAAINFRQQLLTASPDDEVNRIELIRLLAASGKSDEAMQNLAATIADRNATRTLRWQAVWLTPEIVGNQTSLWANVRDRVRSLNASDTEMNTALEALSLSSAGHADEAIKLIGTTENSMPNEYLGTLHAVLAKNASPAEALDGFTRALIATRESTVSKSFGFVEDEPLEQMIGLYLKQNQPRAALKLAERVAALQPNKNSVVPMDEAGIRALQGTFERYQTLRDRAEHRWRATRVNLLALLSKAAEQSGDLNRAVELERLRLAIAASSAERNATQARLDHLQQLQSSASRVQKATLVVDQRLVGGD